MRAPRLAATLLFSSALFIASPAAAQSDAETIADLKAQVEALTRRVAQLEQGSSAALATAPMPVVPVAATSPPARATAAASGAETRPPSVPPAPIDRPLQPFGGAFQLSASNESSEVAIRIGTTLSKPNLGGGARGTATSDSLSLTASAPLDKKTKRGDLGTLDGFTNSSLLKLRWTRFMIPIANPRADPVARARELEIIETARRKCRADAAGKPAELAICNGAYDHAFIEKYASPELADEFYALGFPAGASFAFGLEGSIGYRKFTYFDALSLAELSSEKVPLGAKGFVTWFPNASLTAVTGSLEYQRSFEDQRSAVLCPASDGAPVRCVNGPIGAPNRKNSLLGALELRKQFALKDFWIPAVGVSPQITYDLLQDKGGFDLPIYVVPDAKGNLLGGVRFGYRTDTDDLAVGVFVGSAFSFRP